MPEAQPSDTNPCMLTWTVGQHDLSEPPAFSLTGALLCWADGSPAHVKQAAFTWREGAWHAAVTVSRAATVGVAVSGTLRLDPSVLAAWQRARVKPRWEAAAQLRGAMHERGWHSSLGVVTLRASERPRLMERSSSLLTTLHATEPR